MSKVFVGLSGGVDSAVSAALLKQQGHEVTGCFIKIWQPEFIECTWKEDRLDALRVCAALDIPFREIDFSEEYKREVVESMIADYRRGVTPNPDVLCNEKIKFGTFAKWAFENGADMIATGHYALIEAVSQSSVLRRAKDPAKDQSYFLYRTSQSTLKRTIFPVGGMLKSEVRDAARRLGLPNAQKRDSQGLCFVGEVTLHDFLARYISLEKGAVVDTSGKAIGEHDGAALYTLGQRHGFRFSNGALSQAHYVTGIDVSQNTITVSTTRNDAAVSAVVLENIHWIGAAPELPLHTSVQTRYREMPVKATLAKSGDEYTVTLEKKHIASPGQSLVFYGSDVCLGGGIIGARHSP